MYYRWCYKGSLCGSRVDRWNLISWCYNHIRTYVPVYMQAIRSGRTAKDLFWSHFRNLQRISDHGHNRQYLEPHSPVYTITANYLASLYHLHYDTQVSQYNVINRRYYNGDLCTYLEAAVVATVALSFSVNEKLTTSNSKPDATEWKRLVEVCWSLRMGRANSKRWPQKFVSLENDDK